MPSRLYTIYNLCIEKSTRKYISCIDVYTIPCYNEFTTRAVFRPNPDFTQVSGFVNINSSGVAAEKKEEL